MAQLTPGFKRLLNIFLVIIVVCVLFFGIKYGVSKISRSGSVNISSVGDGSLSKDEKEQAIKIAVVGFSGYSPIYYMNVDPATGNGAKANKNSRAYKEFGLLVELKEMNDPTVSIDAWKSDKVDVHWWTIDSFPYMANSLKEYNPKVFMNVDKSRGVDACVVAPGIKKISDLRGKTIAYQPMSPSETFLMWMLKSANMTKADIVPKETGDFIEAATMFKSGAVDACVTWFPYDQSCLNSVNGSSILCSSKQAPNLIADVMFAKQEYIDNNQDKLQKLYDCWMTGSAELNSSKENLNKAAEIMIKSVETSDPLETWKVGLSNVRFCTAGDNKQFFGLEQNISNLSGEKIYNSTAQNISPTPIGWSNIATSLIVKNSNLSSGAHAAEGGFTFTQATQTDINKQEMSTKQVTINFPFASAVLSEDAMQVIDSQFVDLARAFSSMRIQVEGNTDSIGNADGNVRLSKMRAQSVVNYLINKYQFDRNRFIVIGNGSNNPIADNSTETGRAANRRTEFKLK